ncbi:transporter substrate-binding domain-containing protein [Mycoplasmatota bacterium]|nr:transporter substrate-binding domain-containing protein [Mycoplasmatota bacterium]
MKKLLTLVLSLFIVLTISACSGDDILRVGMDLRYPPFETTVEGEQTPEGISVDIAYALGEYLDREVEIINMDFKTLIPALEADTIDIVIGSMSITEDREKSVDFTDPYFYFKIISLVNSDFALENNIDEDSTKEDLLAIDDAKFVGLVSQVSANIPASYGKEVVEASDIGTAVEFVAQGQSDILLMSANPVVDGYHANKDDTIVVWDSFLSSPIGMAVKEGNDELLEQANAFISTFNEAGGLYDQLAETWDDVLLEELGRYGLEFYINQ